MLGNFHRLTCTQSIDGHRTTVTISIAALRGSEFRELDHPGQQQQTTKNYRQSSLRIDFRIQRLTFEIVRKVLRLKLEFHRKYLSSKFFFRVSVGQKDQAQCIVTSIEIL